MINLDLGISYILFQAIPQACAHQTLMDAVVKGQIYPPTPGKPIFLIRRSNSNTNHNNIITVDYILIDENLDPVINSYRYIHTNTVEVEITKVKDEDLWQINYLNNKHIQQLNRSDLNEIQLIDDQHNQVDLDSLSPDKRYYLAGGWKLINKVNLKQIYQSRTHSNNSKMWSDLVIRLRQDGFDPYYNGPYLSQYMLTPENRQLYTNRVKHEYYDRQDLFECFVFCNQFLRHKPATYEGLLNAIMDFKHQYPNSSLMSKVNLGKMDDADQLLGFKGPESHTYGVSPLRDFQDMINQRALEYYFNTILELLKEGKSFDHLLPQLSCLLERGYELSEIEHKPNETLTLKLYETLSHLNIVEYQPLMRYANGLLNQYQHTCLCPFHKKPAVNHVDMHHTVDIPKI